MKAQHVKVCVATFLVAGFAWLVAPLVIFSFPHMDWPAAEAELERVIKLVRDYPERVPTFFAEDPGFRSSDFAYSYKIEMKDFSMSNTYEMRIRFQNGTGYYFDLQSLDGTWSVLSAGAEQRNRTRH